jgi:hypothetical protein
MKRKWTPATIAAEARKYSFRSDFSSGSVSAYRASCHLGILEQVCSHMNRKPVIKKWTHKTIASEAAKYLSRIEFSNGSRGGYEAARRRKILDEVCAHMPIQSRFTL